MTTDQEPGVNASPLGAKAAHDAVLTGEADLRPVPLTPSQALAVAAVCEVNGPTHERFRAAIRELVKWANNAPEMRTENTRDEVGKW